MGWSWSRDKTVECNDARECFAKTWSGYCTLLTKAYDEGECPFCKPPVVPVEKKEEVKKKTFTRGDLKKLEQRTLVRLTDYAAGLDLRDKEAM